jgi:putative ABC transport system permease protein
MTGFVTDLRSTLRQALRNRGLTLVALTSLAIGIGVSMAITSVSTAVLVRPLPYDKPEDVVMIWRASAALSPTAGFRDPRRESRQLLTPAMILPWRDQGVPFADFAIFESWQTGWVPRVDLIDGDRVERLRGTVATANLFAVLGVRPTLGRTFGENEADVAVISDRLWRRRFGGDRAVLGTYVTAAVGRTRERKSLQIVGVLPERFRFTYPDDTEIWLPLTWAAIDAEPHFSLAYSAVARLRPDMSIEAAEAAMRVFGDQIARDLRSPAHLWLEPVQDYVVGPSRRALMLVAALTLLVLLSGAVNAATVCTASTVSRLRDLRVRRALGASQRRLVRQVFTEAAALAFAAGAVGLVTMVVVLPGLRAVLPAGMPGVEIIRLDVVTLMGVCAAVTFSTLLAGFVPAWLSVRSAAAGPVDDMRTTTLPIAGLRLRMALLATQFALVSALLMTGGMLVRSFWNIVHVDKGFEAGANVYVAELLLMHPAYQYKPFAQFEGELLRRIRELRYVDAASLTSAIPLRGTDFIQRLRRPDGQQIWVNRREVDPAYFEVMGMRLLSGRWLTDADTAQTGWVALVSQSLAELLYPGENPLGKFLEGSSGTRIVGVVADIRARSPLERPMPAFYWPKALLVSNRSWILVRTGMQPEQLGADLRRIVQDIYPEQPLGPLATLEQLLNDSVADRRAYAIIASVLAGAMLLLCGLGLCGHLSHVVAERASDLAIRSALGASSRRQVRLLVRHVIPALIVGSCVAVVAVYIIAPHLAGFLFEVERFDATSSGVSALLVSGFTALAVILPARRALRVDPSTMLRST